MVSARFAAVCVVLLVLAPGAGARTAAVTAPTGLHAFLLRADEPVTDSFSRTPSFAWNPVPGAVSYQFQLATSTPFRENGIVFRANGLTTPVVAPTTTLPWISGNPHSLYARVRAIFPSTTSAWSKQFGFDMTPPPPPSTLPSYDGLLRWSTVEGADGYQVWLLDVPKIETVWTNVLDERELYTFHRDAKWTGIVRWRVRAIRADKDAQKRVNGIPAVTYGAWSDVYGSTNGPFRANEPIRPIATVSDTISDGRESSPSHRLMPGFVWSGDTGLGGIPSELFRVYVFTDRQCLNRVFTGAVVGGPAYAPRPHGPLPLPVTAEGLATARTSYFLTDGLQPKSFTFDGEPVDPTESAQPATPTDSVPSDADSNDAGSNDAGSNDAGSSDAPDQTPAAPKQLNIHGDIGAPVDLWDTEWPEGGYYWTVIPVMAFSPGELSTTVTAPGVLAAATTLPVSDATGLKSGDVLTIGAGATQESATLSSISGNTLTFATPLQFAHAVGETVLRTGGNLEYRDLELAQDACAAGRVARFGKASDATLTSAGGVFASGLSSRGRLVSGAAPKFYGNPLVAWTPAPGASAYEVQWSKTRYPFRPEKDPQNGNAFGRLTLGTSAVLPLRPGVWYYRVRGFSFALPTGAQQLSWSDPARIVVAKPTFRVVRRKHK